MKKILLAFAVALLPLHAWAGFEIEDGALRSKDEEQQRVADEKKKQEEAARIAKVKEQEEAEKKQKAAASAALATQAPVVQAAAAETGAPLTAQTPSVLAAPAVEHWEIHVGSSIEATMRGWALRAGRDFDWDYRNAEGDIRDFTSKGHAVFTGDFPSAIKQLVAALRPANLDMNVEISKNNLVQVTRGSK